MTVLMGSLSLTESIVCIRQLTSHKLVHQNVGVAARHLHHFQKLGVISSQDHQEVATWHSILTRC